VILLIAAFSLSLGASQKGGLPALEARVAKLEAQVAVVISEVGGLQNNVSDLKGQNNWAVVDSSANVIRHSAALNVTAARIGTGMYDVTFGKKDATGCAYMAAIGDVGKAVVPPGFITVSGGVGKSLTDVQVQTFDKDGVPADSSFHLYVSCR
jgi:hypothetical protein